MCPFPCILEKGFFMENKLKNILIVSGSGKNVGKTTFIREIISHGQAKGITAVKISPHFHKITSGLIPVVSGEGWEIFRETNARIQKDSSRFLRAGAETSYYIQAEKTKTAEVYNELRKIIPKGSPVIIESAGIRGIINPGIYAVIISEENYSGKEPEGELMKADLIVFSDKTQFYPDAGNIYFNNGWEINTQK
ncbi:hypothetical protein MNBD_BACTEROID01-2759 [hydrothermal vent metagenome]|uniref:Molybdopterin-guanine dinucleotide biosynthesis protein B (MobB) domain-containing protein n=1 Tax=hydrothermal vent metagenome TaxID=652676 RepID=A0A3B0UG06_9ZZZZ